MSVTKEAYFEALGTNDEGIIQAAFNRAHEVRKFEIELYWRRAAHFWVMQAAIFAAVGFVLSGTSTQTGNALPLALIGLGFLTSVGSWFSSEGSKFWQENWERHIDLLEERFEGHLHKTVWVGGDGIRWSVSGTNGWLNIFFAIFWAGLFIYQFAASADWMNLWLFLTGADVSFDTDVIEAGAIAAAAVICFLFMRGRGTKFEGTVVSLEPELAIPSLNGKPRLITRKKTARSLIKREPRP